MKGLIYDIPVIQKIYSSSIKKNLSDIISEFPDTWVLETLISTLTDKQLKEIENLALDFEHKSKEHKSNILDFKNPDSDLFGEYFTEWNGGKPLRVIIKSDGVVSIYAMPKDLDVMSLEEKGYNYYEDPEMYYTELIKEYKPNKVFLGEEVDGQYWIGNSILMELEPGKYVVLYLNIEEFEIDDEILHYYSPMHGSGLPTPVAVGKKYIYNIADLVYYPIRIYNEDIPEDAKFDFWKVLYEMGGGKPLKSLNIIKNKSFP